LGVSARGSGERVATITDDSWNTIPVIVSGNQRSVRPVLREWQRLWSTIGKHRNVRQVTEQPDGQQAYDYKRK
jgi:hypothetical protein